MALPPENTKDKLIYYLLLLIAFILPLKKEWIVPLVALLFVVSVFFGKKQKMNRQANVFWIALFYFIGLAGVLYSKNTSEAWFNAEVKASLLVFPLAFYFGKIPVQYYLPRILKSFIEGCVVAVLLNAVNSSLLFWETHKISSFFYGESSFFTHVSYYSYYLLFSIVALYHLFFHPQKENYLKRSFTLILIVFFSIAILLGASKSGLLGLLTVHLGASVYWVVRHKKYKQGIISIAVLIGVISLTISTSSTIKNRISEVFSSVEQAEQQQLKPNSSTAIRLIAWKESTRLIKERPLFGYGTGDVSDRLTERYKKKHYDNLVNRHLNSHNQFLQTAIGSGITGLLYFIFLLTYPIIRLQKYKFLYVGFLAITVINFATESMLETQAGVVFFAFFITIFYALTDFKKQEVSQKIS